MPGSTDKILEGFKIKQESIFDLGELYKTMVGWFEANDYKFSEKEYRHFGEGDHVELRWAAEKVLEGYAKIEITIDILILGMKKIEIDIEGAKSKSNQGTIEMVFKIDLIHDHEDKYSPWMRNIYEKFIIKKRLSFFKRIAEKESEDLINEVKSYLKLHQF